MHIKLTYPKKKRQIKMQMMEDTFCCTPKKKLKTKQKEYTMMKASTLSYENTKMEN